MILTIEKVKLLVFITAAIFTFIFWFGLPADFNSDHLTINLRGAKTSSYGDLILWTIQPTTPNWFYPPDRAMERLRPLQFLWMKAYFDLFGSSLVPFYVTAALGLGCLSALIFWIIYRWSGNLALSFLLALWYVTVPSNFYVMTSTFSLDFQYFVSVISIASFLLFSRIAFNYSLKENLIWIVLTWAAIKLKSSEKIIPLVCMIFYALRLKQIISKIGIRKSLILAASILIFIPLVVPFQNAPQSRKDRDFFKFKTGNIVKRL